MSLLLTMEEGWIISHLEYLNKIYDNVMNNNVKCHLQFNNKVFNINSQYLRQNQIFKIITNKRSRKRKKINSPSSMTKTKLEEVKFIRESLKSMLGHAKDQHLFSNKPTIDFNEEARVASEEFYSASSNDKVINFNGCNQSETAIISKIGSTQYVFPENSFFYSYDIKYIAENIKLENQFDFILMDPPWWNKFIRRNKDYSYKMMYNEELCTIPIDKLISSSGIIAIWCTNAENHINDIINILFPFWGIKFSAKWYWVKVTQSGETICDLTDQPGKQPYELIIFGTPINFTSKIPDNKLIISIPSAIHSHKPPISEVLRPYLPTNPNCLEIFARYLLPGWTSWGLEVLKFQKVSLYNSVDEAQNLY